MNWLLMLIVAIAAILGSLARYATMWHGARLDLRRVAGAPVARIGWVQFSRTAIHPPFYGGLEGQAAFAEIRRIAPLCR